MKKPAVFLDRDGTLIEDAGFLRDVAQVDFYPQTFSALRRYATAGWRCPDMMHARHGTSAVQSIATRPRPRFTSPRADLLSIRFAFAALVGLVFTRRAGRS